MKKVWDVLVLLLAINFLAVVVLLGWLYQQGNLNRERVGKIRELLFPPPATQPAGAATQPAADPTTQPAFRLEELLARSANLSAGQQVDFVQHAFDARMAELERRERELGDLKAQVDLANQRLAVDRATLDADRQRLTDEQEQARQLASNQGFQDSLALYASMPPRQVKTIFLTLNDDTVKQYLEAMPSRTASKVIKEFKAPDEVDRIQRILEQMRKGQATTQEAKG